MEIGGYSGKLELLTQPSIPLYLPRDHIQDILAYSVLGLQKGYNFFAVVRIHPYTFLKLHQSKRLEVPTNSIACLPPALLNVKNNHTPLAVPFFLYQHFLLQAIFQKFRMPSFSQTYHCLATGLIHLHQTTFGQTFYRHPDISWKGFSPLITPRCPIATCQQLESARRHQSNTHDTSRCHYR